MPVKLNAAQAKAMGVWTPRKPRKRSGKAKVSKSSPSLFIAACVAQGLPEPIPEFRFMRERKFRFDWSWPQRMVALEIQGGIWTQGKHSRGAGQLVDMEKWNLAQCVGWAIILCTPQDVKTGKVFELLREVLL